MALALRASAAGRAAPGWDRVGRAGVLARCVAAQLAPASAVPGMAWLAHRGGFEGVKKQTPGLSTGGLQMKRSAVTYSHMA
jgi:hypothetical protein